MMCDAGLDPDHHLVLTLGAKRFRDFAALPDAPLAPAPNCRD